MSAGIMLLAAYCDVRCSPVGTASEQHAVRASSGMLRRAQLVKKWRVQRAPLKRVEEGEENEDGVEEPLLTPGCSTPSRALTRMSTCR